MELDEAIEKRRSVRSFKAKKVSFKLVLAAIEAAMKAPFAGNMNNLRFIIVETEDKIKDIADYCHQSWITQAQTVLILYSNDKHLEDIYGDRGRVYSRQQSGAAIQTLLLKLVDLGLSACWVGSYTDDLIRQSVSLPAHFQIEAVIPIGYQGEERVKPIKPKKRNISSSIYWEKWQRERRPAFFQGTGDPLSLYS